MHINKLSKIYTTTHKHASHAIIHLYILVWFNIQKMLRQPVSCARQYWTKLNLHHLHNYTQVQFTRHFSLLHTTQNFISLSEFKNRHHQFGSLSRLVESESSQFKRKFQITMSLYTFDVLPFHQRNILFLLLARDIEDNIGKNILWSNIPTLSHNHYTSLHATAWVAYYIFIRSLKLLTNWWRWGSVRVSY